MRGGKMIKRLYWYDIALRLRDFLRAYRNKEGNRLFDYLADRDSMKIGVGVSTSGEYPALYIDYGREKDVQKQGRITGAKVELWIDLFVKGEAENVVADQGDLMYRQIYMAENELIQALNEFNFHLHRNGLGSNLVVTQVLSDGSANMPVMVANRIVCEIEWYKEK